MVSAYALPDFSVSTLDDTALERAARQSGLALRVDELRRIAGELGREPTVVEVHAFDAQWSEHCSYKSSRHHLRKLPTEGPTVMQGPAEDAGILHLGEFQGERYGVVIAHESHNHPSQVVPFEGAATGVGGIVRDVLCMGAEVIALADPLRFGRTEDPQSHQRYVAQGAVSGISAYGNAIGVPNIAGDVYFDERFDDNCLVNVVALGLVRERDIIHSAAPPGSAGWDIVLVGKATDASGFGGAAFSSVTLDEEDSESNKGAVQVPDPFLKNVIMRASYRVFAHLHERNLTVGFKDLGAGGIMGCSAELCASGGFGAIVDLDDVNAALPEMRPEVLAIGETQERLCWVLPPDVTADVLRIYNEEFTLPQVAREARAVVVGAVSNDNRYVMRHGSEVVMDVPIDFLTGTIRDELVMRDANVNARQQPAPSADVEEALLRVLGHRDVCSRVPLYEQYDTSVRGTTVLGRGSADAGVIAPVHGSRMGVALSVAGNPRFGKIDARLAAEYAVLDSVRKVVSTGARPLGMTDCLNFGSPQVPEQYAELVAAIDGLAHSARELSVPFVSGNVSLYNAASNGNAIPASPIVACVGGFHDIARVVPGVCSRPGDLVYLGACETAFGGSAFADAYAFDALLQPIDYGAERVRSAFLLAAAEAGSIACARAVTDGGIAGALARMLLTQNKPLGVSLTLMGDASGVLSRLFSESCGYVLCVEDADEFQVFAETSGFDYAKHCVRIGSIVDSPQWTIAGTRIDGERLASTWRAPLTGVYA